MVTLIIFLLACYGLTNAIVREQIGDVLLRRHINRWFPYSLLNDMIRCETCCGFWVGIILSLLFPFGIHWLVAGFASSAFNKLINIVLLKF